MINKIGALMSEADGTQGQKQCTQGNSRTGTRRNPRGDKDNVRDRKTVSEGLVVGRPSLRKEALGN